MTLTALAVPVDLTNCDSEPIHLLGNIQPHGVLLACPAGSKTIACASRNAARGLGFAGEGILGRDVAEVLGASAVGALDKCLPAGAGSPGLPGRKFAVSLAHSGGLWDGSVHDYGGLRIYELEPAAAASPVAPLDLVRVMLHELQQSRSLKELCDRTVDLVRRLIGYDRVMIYRFLDDGAGHVMAESRADGLEPLINLRYPASDIPKQARELYKRNWIRIITDVAAEQVPVDMLPDARVTPVDLSHATLRSVSPIHIEYLRNMNVGASLSISIIVGGELWGLIACHNVEAKAVAANVRAAGELLGQVVSLQIQTVEGIDAYVTMRAARALLDRIVAEFPVDGDLIENLAQRLEPLAAFIASDGAGIWIDGVWRGIGLCPPTGEIGRLAQFINVKRTQEVLATQELGAVYPAAADWPSGICGLLAVPLSQASGNYLFFFRKEVAQTIEWGGNPEKPATETAPGRLSPRKSFEAWRQEIRGRSLPWTSRERLVAETLRIYLLDVIVRFSDVILDERRKLHHRARMMTTELNHRVKGTLELIQSLVARGQSEGSVSGYVRALEGRIGAISLAHEAISSGEGPQIRRLITQALAMRPALLEQFDFDGPPVALDPKAFTVLALVIHELTQNAMQFGALAVPHGHVAVRWSRDAAGRVVLDWQEADGLSVRPPVRDGLGLSIIRRNIPHSLDGEADVQFRRSGLRRAFRRSGPVCHQRAGDEQAKSIRTFSPFPAPAARRIYACRPRRSDADGP